MILFFQKYRLWVALVLIVAGATGALFWIQQANKKVRGEARARFFEQYNRQQSLVAEMAASALSEQFATFDRDLNLVASFFEEQGVNRARAAQAHERLRKIYGTVANTPVIELVIFDSEGTVNYIEPNDPYTLGRNYAWREYYSWARKNKNPAALYVSPHITLEGGRMRGERALMVAKGIYGAKGEFRGLAAYCINFDTLARNYVHPVRIGKQGRAWLVDSESRSILVDPNGRVGGQSFDEALTEKWPRLHRFLINAADGNPGSGWYEYEDPEDPRQKVRKLVAFHPIRHENRLWLLGVATPEREVEALLSSFLQQQETISATFLVTMLGGAALLLAFLYNWNRMLTMQVGETHSRLESTFDELLVAQKVAAVGHLALGLAHEIRNPLSSIQMNMQMIRKKIEPSGILSENFSIVDGEIQRLNRLLSDVLDFARPRPLRLQSIEVGEIVRCLLQLLAQRIGELGIKAETTVQSPLHLQGDPEQIQQVLLNLVLNSIEAMEGMSGEKVLKITAYSKDQHAFILVSDTGAGIPKEKREQLFDPFFTTKTAGGGLGLSILQTIVRSHGGTVTAESEPGEGATFIVSLPLAGPPSTKGDTT